MNFKDLKFPEVGSGYAKYCSESMKPFAYGNHGAIAVAHDIREACNNPGIIVGFAAVDNSKNTKWDDKKVLRVFHFVVSNGELYEVFGVVSSKVAGIASEDYGKSDVLSAVAMDRIRRETEEMQSNFSIFRLE